VREYISDELRDGRPATAVTDENVAAVRELILQKRQVTYEQIRATLGIGMSAIQKILHDHLAIRKLCSRWIPHNLTQAQKEARVKWCKVNLKKYMRGKSKLVYNIVTGDESWIYCYETESKRQSAQWTFEGEERPTEDRKLRSVGKKMIANFFSCTGHVATVAQEERRPVNAEWYTTICLPAVFQNVREKRSRGGIILHQNTASSHKAHRTMDFLDASNVKLMNHPAYSPDLAPCDFYLFPTIKEKLRGLGFNKSDAAVEPYRNLVSELPQNEWMQCFKQWFDRMQKCMDAKGEYFEKQ